jgi:hypothetical protein
VVGSACTPAVRARVVILAARVVVSHRSSAAPCYERARFAQESASRTLARRLLYRVPKPMRSATRNLTQHLKQGASMLCAAALVWGIGAGHAQADEATERLTVTARVESTCSIAHERVAVGEVGGESTAPSLRCASGAQAAIVLAGSAEVPHFGSVDAGALAQAASLAHSEGRPLEVTVLF